MIPSDASPAPEIGPTLTVPEAAAVLGMSERTLRRYLKTGVVSGVQFAHAGRWYVPTTEVQRVAEALGMRPRWKAVR